MRHWTVLGFLAVILVTNSAYATDEIDHVALAKKQSERGTTLYNLQQFSAALDQFQAAYMNHSDPVLLFDIAQCQRQLGQYEAAAKSYKAFAYFARETQPQLIEQARRLAAQMEETARSTRAAQTAPPPLALATEQPRVQQPVVTVTAAPLPHRRPWYRNSTGWGVAGGGAALLLVGGALLGVAAEQGQLASSAATMQTFNAYHRSDMAYQQAGWPLLGIGSVGFVTGAILLGVHR